MVTNHEPNQLLGMWARDACIESAVLGMRVCTVGEVTG